MTLFKSTLIPLSTITLALALASASAFAQPPHDKGKKDKKQDHHHSSQQQNHSITIEEAVVRSIFRDQRSYLEPTKPLPPGIRKNLARGKPLPPGIAKRFDNRLESRLPQYPGYDWRQVGTDAVLVSTATGIIESILLNVLN
ncbi:anti-virulence regulator CigR family protein [Halopseudomonas sp.]|jgi:Ni/Co efflux regulator RcnB|uniref:anti-virulence regulator CigR family protein n=1 Tax=Halopseudomonas sp. TaxID=2901191 RepID=UPI0039E63BF5|tara:strand:+ start:763 stop:1188 length:426 start_codon:yes stop_codon:yes gene_type:complete